MPEQAEQIGQHQPRIVRGNIDSLTIYDITDYELDILEKGSPSSLFLNLAIFLLSISIPSGLSLLITPNISIKVFTVYVVITAVGLLGGLILLYLWWHFQASVTEVISKIKQRVPANNASNESVEPSSEHQQLP